VIDRSACACTVVDALELLFPGVGSVVALDTLAVLLNTALFATSAPTVAVITTLFVAPAATTPIPTEPDHGLLAPPFTEYVAPLNPDGNASLTNTACASDGPPFDTVNAYVN
jgi:hypothetical protein